MTTSSLRRIRLIAVASSAVFVLGGCSILGGDDSDSSSSSSSSGDASSVTGDENGAKTAGIDLENPPPPIAETTLPVGKDDVDTTTIELLELKRDDKVMLATFRLTGSGSGNEPKSAFALLGSSTFRPVFIDMDRLEKYRNVDDITTSMTDAEAPLGEPVYVFTAFPLPRDGVSSLDLQITPDTATIDDIALPQ